jgi:hypothetical protein
MHLNMGAGFISRYLKVPLRASTNVHEVNIGPSVALT